MDSARPEGLELSDLGAPPGHEADTRALPVEHVDDDVYGHGIRSYWRLEGSELAELARGGYVRLEILGYGHPPVSLTVVKADDAREVFEP